MKRIRIYYNESCEDCAKKSRTTMRLDWLDRVESSTKEPPDGPVEPGDISVMDLRDNSCARGIEATRRIFKHVPVYMPLLPLSYLPLATKLFVSEPKCTSGACAVSHESSTEVSQ